MKTSKCSSWLFVTFQTPGATKNKLIIQDIFPDLLNLIVLALAAGLGDRLGSLVTSRGNGSGNGLGCIVLRAGELALGTGLALALKVLLGKLLALGHDVPVAGLVRVGALGLSSSARVKGVLAAKVALLLGERVLGATSAFEMLAAGLSVDRRS